MDQTFEKVVTIKLKEYNEILDELTTLREFKNNKEVWCLRKIDSSFGPVGYYHYQDQTFLKNENETIDDLTNRLKKLYEKNIALEYRLKQPLWKRLFITAKESNS